MKNKFDNSTLNILRSDPNYIGLNTTYRAPAFLNGCDQRSDFSWSQFKYYGNNHGDWILYGTGSFMYLDAVIYATADIPAYNGKHGYDIKLIGSVMGNISNDTLTYDGILSGLVLSTEGFIFLSLKGYIIYSGVPSRVQLKTVYRQSFIGGIFR